MIRQVLITTSAAAALASAPAGAFLSITPAKHRSISSPVSLGAGEWIVPRWGRSDKVTWEELSRIVPRPWTMHLPFTADHHE